ncbi:CsbD-like protein [Enterobacter cancerogenus ATCC 35316]|nr:CsbD-like protein [Enterobacter cancerogenus ATCC 35316]
MTVKDSEYKSGCRIPDYNNYHVQQKCTYRTIRIYAYYEDTIMNKDEIGGNWKQFKGKAKEQWGKLTDDDMTVIEGKRDQLVGKIQERYGYEKDQAETEVKDWETRNDYRW